MSTAEPEMWGAGGEYGAGYGEMAPLPFQERILLPRPWQSAEAKNDDSDNDDDDTGKKGDSGKPKSGDKRGGYKCGRCGQPKKGHVCTNKPRLKTAFVETAEAWAQAECDPEMVLRTLDTKAQGFPESYGLTFRWAPAGAMPAYYQPASMPQQQPPPPQPPVYVAAPPGAPGQPPPPPQGVVYFVPAPAAPGYIQQQPQQQPQQQQQQWPQQEGQGGGGGGVYY